MNIFILDENPKVAAQMQCDRHVVKMILETAQMLCSVFQEGSAPYRRTHYNHPCTKWARESRENYEWLLAHGLELAKEYTRRYGRKHKSEKVIQWCKDNVEALSFEKRDLTDFAVCMAEEFKLDSAVESYRNYYKQDKVRFATWNKTRQEPTWWR